MALASRMKFSVVIPTYKRKLSLVSCLTCLAHYFTPPNSPQTSFNLEVIVTDDANDKDLSVFLRSQFPWCIYTVGPACGPASNRNHGAKCASGEWLLFTDDDCLPQLGWIEAYHSSSSDYEVLEGRTSPLGKRSRADHECPINEGGGYLWSCNFAIKRQLFFFLGGFNEDFPAPAMEDVELNTRIDKAGIKKKFLYDATVLHPWRRRNGTNFIRQHSLSVAKFVSLHPDSVSHFTLYIQLVKLFRLLSQNICLAFSTGIYNGLFRQIYLDIFSSLMTWWSVRRLRLTN